MKLLIVHGCTAGDSVGGTEIQLDTIAGFMLSRGHEVCFYTLDYMPGKARMETINGVRIHRNNDNDDGFAATRRHVRRIQGILESEGINVVFARSVGAAYILHQASTRSGVPFVYQLPCNFGDLAVSFSVRHTLGVMLKFRSQALHALLAPRYVRKASRLLTVSRDDAALLTGRFHIPAEAVYNMHPPPPGNPVPQSLRTVVWINNIKPLKRPELFIELARRCVDTGIQFQLAGRIPRSPYGEYIQSLAQGIPGLSILGPVSPEAANQLMERAEINVLTSDREGFSNGAIQGWLRGLPLLTTLDKDGVVARHQLGHVVVDVDGLERGLRRYLAHPDEFRAASIRARKYALANHSIESNGPLYERIFLETAEQGRRSRSVVGG